MDTKTQVLLYLKRNTGNRVRNASGSSRNSASSGASKNSRSPSPGGFSNRDFSQKGDKISENLAGILNELIELNDRKEMIKKKHKKEEEKVLKFFESLIENEKRKISTQKDLNKNPQVIKQAEIIAGKESNIKTLERSNKGMKTLLAEMTLNQVDTKISSEVSHQTKFESLTAGNYIVRNSKIGEDWKKVKFFNEINAKKSKNPENYSEKIQAAVHDWSRDVDENWKEGVSVLCSRIIDEQKSRLNYEESADREISEKASLIQDLETRLRRRKSSKN